MNRVSQADQKLAMRSSPCLLSTFAVVLTHKLLLGSGTPAEPRFQVEPHGSTYLLAAPKALAQQIRRLHPIVCEHLCGHAVSITAAAQSSRYYKASGTKSQPPHKPPTRSSISTPHRDKAPTEG